MNHRHFTILVVDDNDDDRVLIQDLLSKCEDPLQIRTACDGEEALNLLRDKGNGYSSTLPDLILLDVRMPKKDGLEVLQELRADPVLQKIPVLMLTSLSDGAWIEEGFLLGTNGYLTKPVSSAPLLEAIRMIRTEIAVASPADGFDLNRPIVILIAEDSEDDGIMMKEALNESNLPHVAYVVRDGEEAIAFLKHHGRFRDAPRPDVAILDLRMPRRDGIEVIRALHQDPSLRKIRSIIVSANMPRGWIEKEWVCCADAFLNKPVSPFALHDTISSLLSEEKT